MTLKKVIVMQMGEVECGAASLLSIIRYYGGNISMNQLLEITKTNKDGTNFYNLKMAAIEIGLQAKAYKISDYQVLKDISRPYIIQTRLNNYNHFMVVYKVKDNVVTLMDPAKGIVSLDMDLFMNIYTGYIMIFKPYKELPNYFIKSSIKEEINNLFRNNRKLILIIIYLALMGTVFSIITSYYFKILINNIDYKFNIGIITALFLGLIMFKMIINYLRSLGIIIVREKLVLSLVTRVIDKLVSLPLGYFKNRSSGDVLARISDLGYIFDFITRGIMTVFVDFILLVNAFILLFVINSKIGLILTVIVFFYSLLILTNCRKYKDIINMNQVYNARINNQLIESIKGIDTIKNLNLEELFKKKLDLLYLEATNNDTFMLKYFNNLMGIGNYLIDFGKMIIIYIGIKDVVSENLSLSDLVTASIFIDYVLGPINNIINVIKDYGFYKNALLRVDNMLDNCYENIRTDNRMYLSGGIYFKNLEFHYEIDKPIIDRINLSIGSGEKVLLMGESGSGKSTLLKILFKYISIRNEMVYLGGIDINDYSLADIRMGISYISQNELLFTDTIINNVLLGRDCDRRKLLNILRITLVDKIVINKENGYNYLLKDNGCNISGGERQRIILARMLLKDARIMLIDEGLSEVDTKIERTILSNLFKIYPDRTIIVVSHRNSNIDLYSKVIKIANGRIVEGLNKYV